MNSKNNEVFFLQKDKVAFLLIDVQESLMKAVQDRTIIETNMKLLLHLSKIMNIPVTVTTQNAKNLGPTIDSLINLLPEDQKIYDKLVFSCLRVESVLEEIKNRGVLILFGVEAHICVFQTAIQALSKGYEVIVINDAVSSRVDSNKQTGLKRMEKSGVMLYSTEMVIYELLGQAGTENFRRMLPYLRDPNNG
ncbi:MAG: isochorismatase family protein [Candidatus Hodarchaeales archaeon]|jgi:nicotinamidase-related amidase